MGKRNRLSRRILQEDRETLAAARALTDYNPVNKDYELEKVEAMFAAMDEKQTTEVQKKADADGASDDAADSERAAHAVILGLKTQVKAQYGENSNEFQSMGMKKKSEYNVGRRKSPGNNGATN